jgi:hypothetical protein
MCLYVCTYVCVPAAGIASRANRVSELLAKELPKVKPNAWGCVQVRNLWSTKEEQHVRPGHHWLFEFGDTGDGTSCEKEFTRLGRQGKVYKGTRFFNRDRALVVNRWLHRVDEDASGLTFEESSESNPTQSVDTLQEPAPMIINSNQLRAAGFKINKVIPPQLEAAARICMRTRGVGLRQLRGMGSERFVLNVDLDTEFKYRCE